jgi:GTP pyrophosphokinase
MQIRTQAMHDHAEHGVAAHWAYKEAGVKGYAGCVGQWQYDAKIAVLRQLLAWERDLSVNNGRVFDDRIYVLTPDAAIVELPQGATAVDFAYSVHTNLGHRCRGARVDGCHGAAEHTAQKRADGGGHGSQGGRAVARLAQPRAGLSGQPPAKAKVRAWFNALAAHETVARGREAVEKLLQREGKTAVNLEHLASQLGFNCRRPV